jgi:hypothetical protein
MKVFISYSSKQIYFANRIKDYLDGIGIESFYANDDIRVAEEWKDRILDELGECEIIIPILSKEFKESNWCSQEMGVFSFLKKKIIPISIDEMRSYGFFSHVQSKGIEPDFPVELIIAEGLIGYISGYNHLIFLLKNAGGI